ncbi:MAG: amidohydrolase [Gemmataceae bacterium]|nr:amidohydrolase [Gemmataceae bacterium]
MMNPPEYNVTGIDSSRREHFVYRGPIIDIHAHVTLTRPGDAAAEKVPASMSQAESMLQTGREFGIVHTTSMCPPEDIAPLRERFGGKLTFNGPISKKTIDEPDDAAYGLLDRFLQAGVKIIKYWSAPRGRERGLLVDAPWRIDCTKRAIAAGIGIFMVHVADPDVWFQKVYADAAKFGTKADQYVGLERMLQLFPNVTWIGAHMGGDSEHPDHLEALLDKYPNLCFDTSATKWQVREVSPRREAIRSLVCRYPERFLFGTDLVTRHDLAREHYVSRYWCQRTLWESNWEGISPIADPDYTPQEGGASTPTLRGVGLPLEVLDQVYYANAERLLGMT